MSGKFLLYSALGITAVLLLTSDRARTIRNRVEDTAKDNMKKLQKRLNRLAGDTTATLAELKELLSTEVEGLSDDARKRIEAILDGSGQSARKLGNSVSRQLS